MPLAGERGFRHGSKAGVACVFKLPVRGELCLDCRPPVVASFPPPRAAPPNSPGHASLIPSPPVSHPQWRQPRAHSHCGRCTGCQHGDFLFHHAQRIAGKKSGGSICRSGPDRCECPAKSSAIQHLSLRTHAACKARHAAVTSYTASTPVWLCTSGGSRKTITAQSCVWGFLRSGETRRRCRCDSVGRCGRAFPQTL